MKILVCGDRKWTDYEAILSTLKWFKEQVPDKIASITVIEGEATGADTLARVAAAELGIDVMKFPADWQKYGKSAGPIRNQQMLDEGKPNLVLAFHDYISQSKGTLDMINRSKKANITTRLYHHKLVMTELYAAS